MVVVGLVVFVNCGGSRQEPEQSASPTSPDRAQEIGELDGRARASCALLLPIADDVRTGKLTGPPLFRALQDVFNAARETETEGFAVRVADLLNASIREDEMARIAQLRELVAACEDAD